MCFTCVGSQLSMSSSKASNFSGPLQLYLKLNEKKGKELAPEIYCLLVTTVRPCVTMLYFRILAIKQHIFVGINLHLNKQGILAGNFLTSHFD
uniref:Uncharacterized protein n=1 Tax=Phasianus colchicus TaxID=9054 RepID=A0A669P5W6_PHACC